MTEMIDHAIAKRNISANIQRLLTQSKMSQSDLARETGDNRVYISRVARGISEPTSSGLARIAEALQVITDELLQDPAKKLQHTP